MNRRRFLQAGSIVLGLPLLESDGFGQDDTPVYSFFCRQANGVTQGDSNGELDRFWPHETGIITPELLSAQGDRVLSELAPFANSMVAVKGLSFGFPSAGCGHSGGGNQCLTAAQCSTEPSGPDSLAMGESVDNYIARHFSNNGGEPITLYTGPRRGYLEEVLSYRGPMSLRAAEDNPWVAYQRMLGVEDATLSELVFTRRQSVNDLILDQIQALRSRRDLSSRDQQKLELHFDSIRDFERLATTLSEDEEQAMAEINGLGVFNDNRITVAKMHMDLIALAFSCDYARSATLQIGDGNDATEYTVDGQKFPSFHWVSHRIYADGSEGETIEGAEDMHHAIDRLMAQTFSHFLNRISEYGILEQCMSVLCSDLGNGVSHSYDNVPFIVVGSANGFLRTGQFIDMGGVTHNKLFNTLISASGIRNDEGEWIENFGDSSLDGGVIAEMISET